MEAERRPRTGTITKLEISQAMAKLAQMMALESRALGLGHAEDYYDDDEDNVNVRDNESDGKEAKAAEDTGASESGDEEGIQRVAQEVLMMIENPVAFRQHEGTSNHLSLRQEIMASEATTMMNNNYRQAMTQSAEDIKPPPNKSAERLYEHGIHYKEQQAARQYRRYMEELATLKSKPDINETSKVLATKKAKMPIHKRTGQVLEEKQRNLEKLKEEVESRKEKLPSFHPELPSRIRNPSEVRSVREFTKQVYTWQAKKNEAIQKGQHETMTRELDDVTFRPLINQKSRVLAEKNSKSMIPYERFMKYEEEIGEKKDKILEKHMPTFKPSINKKSSKLVAVKDNNNTYRTPTKANATAQKHTRTVSSTPITAKTFIDLRSGVEDPPDLFDASLNMRSFTPERTSSHAKTSKIQEVEYNHTMEFLVKKIEVQKFQL